MQGSLAVCFLSVSRRLLPVRVWRHSSATAHLTSKASRTFALSACDCGLQMRGGSRSTAPTRQAAAMDTLQPVHKVLTERRARGRFSVLQRHNSMSASKSVCI
jgi:hypothetical protein